ncbi:transposable element Tcb2 transposase [Trichonephila clavipes]|nr:transposable element Tcb2 transposase [Trichonephila clavipes]
MSQQRDLPESMAWRVIGRLKSGQTQRGVADAVGVARSVKGCGIDYKKQEMLDVDQGQKSWLDGMGWNQHRQTYGPAYHSEWHFDRPKDGNARPHRARLVEIMLEAETIQRMEWPACSPDLNPIEHVRDMLGRCIAARPRLPATVRDLEIALLEEWNSIPQSLIDKLIASMANRCAAVLAVRGDYTPYKTHASCLNSTFFIVYI